MPRCARAVDLVRARLRGNWFSDRLAANAGEGERRPRPLPAKANREAVREWRVVIGWFVWCGGSGGGGRGKLGFSFEGVFFSLI